MTELTRGQVKEVAVQLTAWAFNTEVDGYINQLLDHDAAQREKLKRLSNDYKKLVAFYDQHFGTPCEQIRHQQEVDELKEKLAAVERERDEARDELFALKDCLRMDHGYEFDGNIVNATAEFMWGLKRQLTEAQARIAELMQADMEGKP